MLETLLCMIKLYMWLTLNSWWMSAGWQLGGGGIQNQCPYICQSLHFISIKCGCLSGGVLYFGLAQTLENTIQPLAVSLHLAISNVFIIQQCNTAASRI